MNAGTPAEKILDMMSQLLRGITPVLHDVLLVRTTMLQSFDLYAPIGVEQRIRDAVKDVSTYEKCALVYNITFCARIHAQGNQ